MRCIRTGAVAVLMAFATSASIAAPAWVAVVPPTPPDGVVFRSVGDLDQHAAVIEAQLIHGQEADASKWPATFFIVYESGGKQFGCGAAAVGPRVLLTAAHCVPASGKVSIKVGAVTFPNVDCARDPTYAVGPDPSADFALCRLPPGVFAGAMTYEVVSVVPADGLVGVANGVLLGGFGCTTDSALGGQINFRQDSNGNSNPVYDIGLTSVERASFSPDRKYNPRYYLPYEHSTLVTKADGPALCGGDSGGPVFAVAAHHDDAYRPRAIVGVNSRVLHNGSTLVPSLLSATGGFAAAPLQAPLQTFEDWAKSWASGLTICGVTGNAQECIAQ